MNILSPVAITQLWDQHSGALALYARQWCDSPEDVVQEAFLLLVRQVVAPDNSVGWLYRVVRNRAINASRSRGRQARHETAATKRFEPWFEPSVGDRLDAVAAADALRHLPIEQREAIVARVWGGLSFEEIARLSGNSLSKVYRSYQRGLVALRERLEGSCLTTKTKTKS
jgi:RNA polymerase sigma factor (sigma-70 family)